VESLLPHCSCGTMFECIEITAQRDRFREQAMQAQLALATLASVASGDDPEVNLEEQLSAHLKRLAQLEQELSHRLASDPQKQLSRMHAEHAAVVAASQRVKHAYAERLASMQATQERLRNTMHEAETRLDSLQEELLFAKGSAEHWEARYKLEAQSWEGKIERERRATELAMMRHQDHLSRSCYRASHREELTTLKKQLQLKDAECQQLVRRIVDLERSRTQDVSVEDSPDAAEPGEGSTESEGVDQIEGGGRSRTSSGCCGPSPPRGGLNSTDSAEDLHQIISYLDAKCKAYEETLQKQTSKVRKRSAARGTDRNGPEVQQPTVPYRNKAPSKIGPGNRTASTRVKRSTIADENSSVAAKPASTRKATRDQTHTRLRLR